MPANANDKALLKSLVVITILYSLFDIGALYYQYLHGQRLIPLSLDLILSVAFFGFALYCFVIFRKKHFGWVHFLIPGYVLAISVIAFIAGTLSGILVAMGRIDSLNYAESKSGLLITILVIFVQLLLGVYVAYRCRQ